jgi:outer membrane protein assembly factor BamB
MLRASWSRSVARAAVTALVLAGVQAGFSAAPAAADTLTAAQDSLRTAWDSSEPALDQSAVAASTFGQLFSTPVDGQVYAQPLVVGSRVFVATETNNVYALDAGTGAVRWSRNLGKPWDPAIVHCGDLTPSIGISGTPVYDPATNGLYFTAKTADGADQLHPNWYMHGMDATTGAERPGFPVLVAGAPSNDSAHPFNPLTAAQRPALVIRDGVVYAGFASHCDISPYVGYVVGVSTGGKQTAMWSTEGGSASGEAGIWQSGAGLVSDATGLLFATGNGISPQPSPGRTPPATLAESVVRLTVQPDGSLTASDFFSPANNAKLDQDDADLGSGGPLAVPDGYGTAAHPHLLVEMGKDGHVYVLDRDNLGGMAQGPGGSDAVLDEAGPYNGVWGRSAFLGTAGGGYIYNTGNGGYLRAFKLSPTGSGGVAVAAVGASAGTFPYSSGSPVVTSNGTDASSALVWVVNSGGGATGSSAELRAYRALPDGTGVLQQVFAAPIGTSVKFASPTTAGGRVYVGTRDGKVLAFGAPTRAALGAASTDLGSAPVGSLDSGTVTVTANRAITLTSAAATAPFTVGALPLPLQLAQGASAAIPVSFTPSTWGQTSGTLSLSTADGETVKLDVHGLGTQAGLGAGPATLDFAAVPTGSKSVQTVNIVNTGTTPVTVTGVTPPTSPELTVDSASLPTPGQQLQPQQSLAVSVTYTPTGTQGAHDTLTVTSDLGSVEIPIAATAVSGAPHLTTPTVLSFGDVAVGLSRTLSFPITNDGNIAMTINKAKAPAGAFSTATPIAEGLVIPPGDTAYQSVTFTPTATGQVGDPSTYYLISTDDGTGAHEVMLTGNGVSDPLAVLGALHGGTYATVLGVVASAPFAAGDGECQSYTNGYVCVSPTAGQHYLYGPVAARYRAAGGPTGQLGLPTTDLTPVGDGVGSRADFSGAGAPSIYSTPTTGAHIVLGAIKAKWLAMGGPAGPLGYPATDETATATGGRFNHFSGLGGNASIYWSPATGAHPVWGAIRNTWSATGWERNLGYPVTDEICGLRGGACGQQFSYHTSIYWSPATGAHLVRGGIRGTWAARGWENGRLGYPTTDEVCGLVQGGCAEQFQGGSIYWSPATGAHPVWGAIRNTWSATGRERNLGYPVTDEICGLRGGGCGQQFSNHTSIYWTPATGAHLVRGGIRGTWATLGWQNGRLGYPTTDEVCGLVQRGCAEQFQGGSIYWSPATGAHEVWGAFRAYWVSSGRERGSLGYPTSNEYIANGMIRQNFQGGHLLFNPRTGRTVRY